MFIFDYKYSQYKKIHFIGIGGVSMSGIALLLSKKGYEVTGSDRSETKYLNHLYENGIKIYIGQKASNIGDQDLFIYTDAILPDNEELIAAKTTGKPVVTRGEFLGALMRNYNQAIAISGSHGKSTTTSMLSKVLVDSKADATILLGGLLDELDGNVKVGQGEILLTEACEFKGNILYYYPSTVVILNIDEDHLDYYKDLNHIVETFIGYMKNLDENSKAIINIDDENTHRLLEHVKGEVITFGQSEDAEYRISDLDYSPDGFPRFNLVKAGKTYPIALDILGDYNIYNAAATTIAALENGINFDLIKKSLSSYHNLHRRMETVGYYNDATVMTDYGHHPVEIKNTLKSLRKMPHNKIISVFQPHTYSRTKALLDDFSEAFFDADEVIVTKIFPAREKFDPTIKSEDLVKKLIKNGVNAIYLKTFEEAKDYLRKRLKKGNICMTTGCGNPDELAEMIVGEK